MRCAWPHSAINEQTRATIKTAEKIMANAIGYESKFQTGWCFWCCFATRKHMAFAFAFGFALAFGSAGGAGGSGTGAGGSSGIAGAGASGSGATANAAAGAAGAAAAAAAAAAAGTGGTAAAFAFAFGVAFGLRSLVHIIDKRRLFAGPDSSTVSLIARLCLFFLRALPNPMNSSLSLSSRSSKTVSTSGSSDKIEWRGGQGMREKMEDIK